MLDSSILAKMKLIKENCFYVCKPTLLERKNGFNFTLKILISR